jgi:hypothetical protein
MTGTANARNMIAKNVTINVINKKITIATK